MSGRVWNPPYDGAKASGNSEWASKKQKARLVAGLPGRKPQANARMAKNPFLSGSLVGVLMEVKRESFFPL